LGESGVLFLRPKSKVVVEPESELSVDDLVDLVGPKDCLARLTELSYTRAPRNGGQTKTISLLELLVFVTDKCGSATVQPIAANDILVQAEEVSRQERSQPLRTVLVVFAAVLFVFGGAMAIMNFHADVSMAAVHEQLYFLLTGERVARPLWMQIPYSLGVGLGILLFFNLLRKPGPQPEPSPLELEMYLYGRNMDQFRLAQQEQEEETGEH
jgi:stage V sporulation protein AA